MRHQEIKKAEGGFRTREREIMAWDNPGALIRLTQSHVRQIYIHVPVSRRAERADIQILRHRVAPLSNSRHKVIRKKARIKLHYPAKSPSPHLPTSKKKNAQAPPRFRPPPSPSPKPKNKELHVTP
jgi:hypothetical protein